MVLDSLSENLQDALKKVAQSSRVDKELVKEVVREIQRALIKADVDVRMAMELTETIEDRALNEKPKPGITAKEHVIRIVYEELVEILGEARDVPLKRQVIMLVGLYGQGKTTTAGKLARYFKKKGLKAGLIAGDVHRPAAVDQLEQVADQVGAGFYGDKDEEDAVQAVEDGIQALADHDVMIVDTSGRHKLEGDLIEEMEAIFEAAKPDEKWLVIDATVGQQAGSQAEAFHEAVGLSGVIITKLDGSAKGGGALSAVGKTGAPVVFVGVGESMSELETFEPDRFISRILGMGDLQTLMETIEDEVDEDRAEETAEKIMSGKFTLKEMYDQMDMMASMGPVDKIMDMLPGGMSGGIDQEDFDKQEAQLRLDRFKVIMDSMTEHEMENPKEIKSSRMKRIARGAGVAVKDVKELLKHYRQSKNVIQGITSDRAARKKLMKQLKFGQ